MRFIYCPECQTRQRVEELDSAPSMRPWGEVAQPMAWLVCGHDVALGPEVVVAEAPGAPYAGPGVAVAASTRSRDLRAADARQAQLISDPWLDA